MSEYQDPEFERALEMRRREERRAVEEAGGGEAEGFELAEQELIEHASHGDEHSTTRIIRDAEQGEEEPTDTYYGEPDEERVND
jgi:hypothetical protein